MSGDGRTLGTGDRRILCTLPHASESINGIPFHKTEEGMLSEPVTEAVANTFHGIRGYQVITEELPADDGPAGDDTDAGETSGEDSSAGGEEGDGPGEGGTAPVVPGADAAPAEAPASAPEPAPAASPAPEAPSVAVHQSEPRRRGNRAAS